MKVAALALFWAASAHAMTGNQLHELMASDSDQSYRLAALAYVTGLTDGISYAQFVAKMRQATNAPGSICLPDNAQVGQAYDVIKAFLANNPSQRHLDAGTLSAAALYRVWPCK